MNWFAACNPEAFIEGFRIPNAPGDLFCQISDLSETDQRAVGNHEYKDFCAELGAIGSAVAVCRFKVNRRRAAGSLFG